MKRLEGKSALIIGGSTGIGEAVCRLFAAEGAKVAVADFGRRDARSSVVAGIADAGGQALDLECDVTDETQVAAAVEATVRNFGDLDILVNNAGISVTSRAFSEQNWDEWQRVIDVNLRGVAYGMTHGLRHMQPRGTRVAVSPSPVICCGAASSP